MSTAATVLDREEYVEQAHLFRVLGERMRQNMAVQESADVDQGGNPQRPRGCRWRWTIWRPS